MQADWLENLLLAVVMGATIFAIGLWEDQFMKGKDDDEE